MRKKRVLKTPKNLQNCLKCQDISAQGLLLQMIPLPFAPVCSRSFLRACEGYDVMTGFFSIGAVFERHSIT